MEAAAAKSAAANLSNMGRPKTKRCNCLEPTCIYFKPYGSRGNKKSGVSIGVDELTSLKLHDVDGLSQNAASRKMKISQPTFARILASAHQKLSSAIVGGGEIKII